jgi:uncharacterized membrane protein
MPRLEKFLVGTGLVALSALLTAWCTRILIRRPGAGSAGSVRAILDANPPKWIWAVVALGVALMCLAFLRRRSLLCGRTLAALATTTLVTFAITVALPHGQHVAIAVLAAGLAILLAAQLPATLDGPDPNRRNDAKIALGIFAAVFAVYAFFSMRRYYWMGAGSWDMGCMIHNLYRASRGLDTTSTVLGGVDFLGDHFMIGLYLYSPFAWINADGYTMLAIQCASLGVAAPVIFLLARDRGAPLSFAIALSLAAAFAFGMQSGVYFDAHEITIGFGFLAFGVLFLERKRLVLATICFVLFSLFKESLGAYVIALGMLAFWRGLRDRDAKHLIAGTGWLVYGAVWFVLVNRVFMPMLIARGAPPEPHETFADFGPTVFTALLGILSHPVEAFGSLFTPAEKMSSLLVTFGGIGYLALFRPELLLAAAPLFAERFLSSKHAMWEMGYHYAAPLAFYSAWAAAVSWPKVQALSERVLAYLSSDLRGRSPAALSFYVLASMILINSAGYRHPANFHHLREDYFSTPERRAQNAKAIALIEDQGIDAKAAVQNRMLPHLADRPHIYRLGDYLKADYVLLNTAEDAWPYDGGHPKRLRDQLAKNPAWIQLFHEGDTFLFARKSPGR